MEIEVVVPMAGLGSRFLNFSNTAKPLIMVHGYPIFLWAVFSLNKIWGHSRFTFVHHKDDGCLPHIEKYCRKLNLKFQSVELTERTAGPSDTLYRAKDFINEQSRLISLDCDLFFSSDSFFEFILSEFHIENGNICYFNSSSDRYGYIQTDRENKIVDIAEKKVISDKAVIGAYSFPHAKDVFAVIEEHNKTFSSGFPISKIVEIMLSNGIEFYAQPMNSYFSFGTPEELSFSLKQPELEIYSATLEKHLKAHAV